MSTYWEDRAEEILLAREKETEKYIDKIARIYKDTENQINFEIQKIFNKYSENGNLIEKEAGILLSNKESKEYYDKLLKQINTVKDKDLKKQLLSEYNSQAYNYRISRLEALKNDIYVKCKVLADKELEYSTKSYTGTIKNTYSDYKEAIAEYKTSQAISFATIDNNVLNRILTTNWLGSSFSNRIWVNSELLETSLNNILQKGILSGLSIQKMSKELKDVMQTSTFNAERLIRTETNHFHNQAELQLYIDDDIMYYKYLSTLDNRTSLVCTDLNGKIFKVKEAKTSINYPPMHPFCRSTTVPVFEDELELTDVEKQAVKDYTGFEATRINKAIRTNNITSDIQDKIDILDNAITKSKPLSNNMIVHRGTIIQSIAGFENNKNVQNEEILGLSETVIKDRAFISTSKVKPEELGKNVIMNIKVPKDFKGALEIKEYAADKYKYQDEVLLKRNTSFFINKIDYKEGKYYFDMEVIE